MKNRVVAGVLGILLGTLGVHKFYLGYVGLGAWGRLRRGKSQSLSLVVPVGAASDVNRPAMSPTTSSRVSATSRISRPTSRVRARPTGEGVWTSRARTPIAEATRRRRPLKEEPHGEGRPLGGAAQPQDTQCAFAWQLRRRPGSRGIVRLTAGLYDAPVCNVEVWLKHQLRNYYFPSVARQALPVLGI